MIGNEIGADTANGYPQSIPVNLQPFGGSSESYVNNITGLQAGIRRRGAGAHPAHVGAALPAGVMMTDYSAMNKVAFFGFLITAGVIAATLSSAMASFLGAPRILQSLSADRIFPFLVFFAKGSGPTANPRRGVLLSAGIAYATVAWGQLNLIAPVVSMFFLISYGLLNYATYYEARAASPSFRPRFRFFDRRLSLLGALACAGAMLAINITAAKMTKKLSAKKRPSKGVVPLDAAN